MDRPPWYDWTIVENRVKSQSIMSLLSSAPLSKWCCFDFQQSHLNLQRALPSRISHLMCQKHELWMEFNILILFWRQSLQEHSSLISISIAHYCSARWYLIECSVFNAAFNMFSIISRRFLGKLPSVLLVHYTDTSQSVVMLTPQPWTPRWSAIT